MCPREISRGSNFFTVPRVDSVFQSRAFSYAAPHLWNSLSGSLRALADTSCFPSSSDVSYSASTPDTAFPVRVQESSDLSLFKHQLKTYLFSNTCLLTTWSLLFRRLCFVIVSQPHVLWRRYINVGCIVLYCIVSIF